MKEETPTQTPASADQPSRANTPQGSAAAAYRTGSSDQQSQGNPTPTASGPSTYNTPSSASNVASSSAIHSSPGNQQNPKRRRGIGVVTPNACTECRKKRAKCDGQKPCGRCKAQGAECVYEVPVRQSKEHLRSEIEQLRSRQRSNEKVIEALKGGRLWEEVLRRLQRGQSIETISEWLGGTLPSGGGTMPSGGGAFPPASSILPPTGVALPSGAGTLPSVGTLPPFRPQNELSPPVLAPISQFANTGPVGMAAMNLGMNSANTAGPQPTNLRPAFGHQASWSFSSLSQSEPRRRSVQPGSIAWMTGQTDTRAGSSADNMPAGQSTGSTSRLRVDQILSPINEPEKKLPSVTWTTISSDVDLVQHLLALYFCWEYPTFASLSKEHFLRDFQDGRYRYCSPILVNALLALGCRFSTQPMTRANPNDPYSSGDHFFKESQRLFYQETDHHSLTTIQALGIMSIREASCGRDSESWYYAGQSIRLAIEMGLHRVTSEGDEDELAVQSATFWGAFALDHAWSLATGSLPQCSSFPHLPPKPAIIDDIEASLWVPYSDDGAPLQRSCEQPSNVRSVYTCFCELSELVHQSLYVLHSPGRHLTARDLLVIYRQYLSWYDRIPEVLRLGHNFTPAVLFAHMYYHFAILLLFRPLIKLRIVGSKVLPRDVCAQAADAIQGLLRSYSQLYTLRRTPSFVPYFVLTSSIMHLAIGAASQPELNSGRSSPEKMDLAKLDPRVHESISQGIADLTEMAPCHHFAEQALNILRYLANKWGIDVDIIGETVAGEDYDRLVRPHSGSLNFFSPNVQEGDFLCDWGFQGGVAVTTGDEKQKRFAADSMENPLFWPFPMQGRPILPSGDELVEAGFRMLHD